MKYLLIKKYIVIKALTALSLKFKVYLLMFAIGIGTTLTHSDNPLEVNISPTDINNTFIMEVLSRDTIDLNIRVIDDGNNKVIEETAVCIWVYKKEYDFSQLDKGEYKILVSNRQQIVSKSIRID